MGSYGTGSAEPFRAAWRTLVPVRRWHGAERGVLPRLGAGPCGGAVVVVVGHEEPRVVQRETVRVAQLAWVWCTAVDSTC